MIQHHSDRVSGLTVAYIGGGSRGWAWGFMTDIACDEQISGTIRLYDIDREAAQRNKIIGEKILLIIFTTPESIRMFIIPHQNATIPQIPIENVIAPVALSLITVPNSPTLPV